MKRPYILVIIGVLLIVAAISLNYMLTRSVNEEDGPAQTTAPPAVTADDSEIAAQNAPAPADTAPEVRTPSFDVVRIGPDGNAVIAGRAAPNSTVRIREGDEIIGQATADERGEWVVLPEKPLASGDRELSLESEDSAGEIHKGDDNVVVLIPEKPASGEPATAEKSGDDAEGSTEQPIIAMRAE